MTSHTGAPRAVDEWLRAFHDQITEWVDDQQFKPYRVPDHVCGDRVQRALRPVERLPLAVNDNRRSWPDRLSDFLNSHTPMALAVVGTAGNLLIFL